MPKRDLYDDGPENAPQDQDSNQEPDQGDPGEGGEKDETGSQAVIPKALLAGKDFKPGDEIVLKIDSIHGDEVVVSYAPEKKDEEAQGGEDQGQEPMAGGAQEGAAPGAGPMSMMD